MRTPETAPERGDDWVGLSSATLPVGDALSWLVLPGCGAVVVFVGTVRDHSHERNDVTSLYYEAYAEQVGPRLEAIASEIRNRWPGTGRLVLLHRIGSLSVCETSVVVAVSAPHRAEAFLACRYGIDAVKTTVPIWKQETWAGGQAWSTCTNELVEIGEVDS